MIEGKSRMSSSPIPNTGRASPIPNVGRPSLQNLNKAEQGEAFTAIPASATAPRLLNNSQKNLESPKRKVVRWVNQGNYPVTTYPKRNHVAINVNPPNRKSCTVSGRKSRRRNRNRKTLRKRR